MNKEYYNNYINKIISDLIEEKDMYCEDISTIATYLGEIETKNNDLCRIDISSINEKRNNMATIYKLIEDLEELKKESE